MDIYEEIVQLRRDGRRGAVATIVNVRGSIPSFKTAKMLVRDDGSIVGTIGGGCVEAEVWQAAREVMESEKPRTLSFNLNQDPKYDTGLLCGGTLDIFIEPVLPPALLYLFGAGHVALNVCRVAANAGFEVIVADDRASYATQERFPCAREIHAADTSGRSRASLTNPLPRLALGKQEGCDVRVRDGVEGARTGVAGAGALVGPRRRQELEEAGRAR